MILFLAACSPGPSPDIHSPQEMAHISSSIHEGIKAGLIADGWRPGSLELRVSIQQGGELLERSAAAGGIETEVFWAFTLDAQRLVDVLVAPDLSILLPETDASEEARRAAFKRSPVYIGRSADQSPSYGAASYTKRMAILSPHSSSYTHLEEITEGQGEVSALNIIELHPSFYGHGYELKLDLAYGIAISSIKTAESARGPNTHLEEERPEEENLYLHLFPSPDRDVFDSYPFVPSSDSDSSITQSEALDIFTILRNVHEGVTFAGSLRPGLQWDADKNQLRLSYTLSGNSQPPLFGDVTGLATRIDPNLVTVELLIKALH